MPTSTPVSIPSHFSNKIQNSSEKNHYLVDCFLKELVAEEKKAYLLTDDFLKTRLGQNLIGDMSKVPKRRTVREDGVNGEVIEHLQEYIPVDLPKNITEISELVPEKIKALSEKYDTLVNNNDGNVKGFREVLYAGLFLYIQQQTMKLMDSVRQYRGMSKHTGDILTGPQSFMAYFCNEISTAPVLVNGPMAKAFYQESQSGEHPLHKSDVYSFLSESPLDIVGHEIILNKMTLIAHEKNPALTVAQLGEMRTGATNLYLRDFRPMAEEKIQEARAIFEKKPGYDFNLYRRFPDVENSKQQATGLKLDGKTTPRGKNDKDNNNTQGDPYNLWG